MCRAKHKKQLCAPGPPHAPVALRLGELGPPLAEPARLDERPREVQPLPRQLDEYQLEWVQCGTPR